MAPSFCVHCLGSRSFPLKTICAKSHLINEGHPSAMYFVNTISILYNVHITIAWLLYCTVLHTYSTLCTI